MAKKINTDIELDDIAEILQIHPRTVLRYIHDDVNIYWAEGHNPVVNLDDVANGFGEDPLFFVPTVHAARKGRDKILKPSEAAAFIKVPLRTFRHRRYPALIRCGNIVRYSRYDVVNHNIEKFTKLK